MTSSLAKAVSASTPLAKSGHAHADVSLPGLRAPVLENGGATLQQAVAAIRVLAMDAVQQANSGHPGMPMGMAEVAAALWLGWLRHNPTDPNWINRDRYVLSNGHGSMLLYALLHLSGYDLPIEQLRQFRQLHSQTPGHPERGITPGVETTTGPLGQGLANAVGMALAETLLADEFNRPGHTIIDHYTYAFVGDGCLMEGISHEVCSLAGTWGLSKLTVLYDDNGISIDGKVEPWFSDDTAQRFEAYGWRVVGPVDGHDAHAVSAALANARASAVDGAGPALIICKTVIGQGAPSLAGTDKVHGAPLGAAEVAATRAALGWSHGPFELPDAVYASWDARAAGAAAQAQWQSGFDAYQQAHPELARELLRRVAGELPTAFAAQLPVWLNEVAATSQTPAVASRKSSQQAIARLAQSLPELLGGSADLTGSNFTDWPGAPAMRRSSAGRMQGRHINYGVREFGMAAIMSGIALHGGYIPYGGTFLTFSDYARNALRMAALMKLRVIHVLTHDSIGLGEDGPTHQSIEHIASLRLIPHMSVWRPCDSVETQVAWQAALQRRDGPTCLVLSRQNLTQQPRSAEQLAAVARGGYVLCESTQARAVLLATGSEVMLAVAARELLAAGGVAVRVVSMPSTDVFDRQSDEWRASVLPPQLPIIAIEAGTTQGWHRYVGITDAARCQPGQAPGAIIGIDTFGESAPAPALYAHFGLTPERIAQTVQACLAKAA